MTYCVGIRLDAGLVFLSDSRTNAGMDQISTFRKMMIYEKPGDRFMVMLSAGNLSHQPERARDPAGREARQRRRRAADHLERHQHVRRHARAGQRGAPRVRAGRPVAEGQRHRLQRQHDLRRPDQGRGDAHVPGLLGRQLHRGHARDLLLPGRREQVRQAHPGPRADAGNAAGRSRQVRAGVDGLDAEVQPVGGPAAGPAGLPRRRAAQRRHGLHRRAQPLLPHDPQHLGPAPARGVRGHRRPALGRRRHHAPADDQSRRFEPMRKITHPGERIV
jgi:hypothetical protein